MAGKKEYGLYYGTLFRSFIPVLAVVMVVLSLATGPLLVRAEKTYLAGEFLMTDTRGGFTRAETDLTFRLRDDMLARFDALEEE